MASFTASMEHFGINLRVGTVKLSAGKSCAEWGGKQGIHMVSRGLCALVFRSRTTWV